MDYNIIRRGGRGERSGGGKLTPPKGPELRHGNS